jgi:hypothetical protein
MRCAGSLSAGGVSGIARQSAHSAASRIVSGLREEGMTVPGAC